jgi:ABC-type transporter Mla maintaining outer membrane lipid asymmetry ATPase subunit MlaF
MSSKTSINDRTSINGAANNRTSINGSQLGSFQKGRSSKDIQSASAVVKNNIFEFNVTVKVENKRDGKTTTICDNVTASVKSGNMVAIIGPSGAGTVTLVQPCHTLSCMYAAQILFEKCIQ